MLARYKETLGFLVCWFQAVKVPTAYLYRGICVISKVMFFRLRTSKNCTKKGTVPQTQISASIKFD